MPRQARAVFAGIPHHVTQRGNRRENVFFSDGDRRVYLAWLKAYCDRHGVALLAYCLMPNHIHLVAVPAENSGLERALKPLHMRYAQRINRAKGWHGHLWQGRFFSSALDEAYLWAALRYVERNPVRARLVRKAENYPWSSAAAHCGLRADPALTNAPDWVDTLAAVRNWSGWLTEGDEAEELAVLRRNADKGLPCGSETFVKDLEARADRSLHFRPIGRPRSEKGEKGDANLY